MPADSAAYMLPFAAVTEPLQEWWCRRPAVNRGDDRLLHAPMPDEIAVVFRPHAVAGSGALWLEHAGGVVLAAVRIVVQCLEISAYAELPACTGDHDDARRWILVQVSHDPFIFSAHAPAPGIAAARTVEAHNGNTVAVNRVLGDLQIHW